MYLRATHHVDSADLSVDPIFDISDQSPLFVKLSAASTRWEIPESRQNFFRPASFTTKKATNQRRIFVLGGSTVQGRPYETETAFSLWMQLRLKAADPAHAYEVVNCGGVSYASYRIAIILDEVLSHAPDAIVIYTGHNEFLEERSYGTKFIDDHRLLSIVGRSHLARSIRDCLRPASHQREHLSPQLKTRLDLVDGMKRYVRDPDWRRGVELHFRATLERMIQSCKQANVPLVLCVPTSDIVRTPPMKVLPMTMDETTSLRFNEQWKIANDPHAVTAERRKACAVCLEIDPEHSGAHYVAGMIDWELGETTDARFHLIAARDSDVCPLRATTPIVQQILDAAQLHGIAPIRCDQLFDRTDSLSRPIPDGIADPQRFVDHIHPTISDHQEIAQAVADQLIDLLEIQPVASAEDDYRSSVTDHLSSLDEPYYARARQRLEGLKNWAAGRAGESSD